jgi:hypothetical protein
MDLPGWVSSAGTLLGGEADLLVGEFAHVEGFGEVVAEGGGWECGF